MSVGGAAVIATLAHDGFMNPVEGTENKYGNLKFLCKFFIYFSRFILLSYVSYDST